MSHRRPDVGSILVEPKVVDGSPRLLLNVKNIFSEHIHALVKPCINAFNSDTHQGHCNNTDNNSEPSEKRPGTVRQELLPGDPRTFDKFRPCPQNGPAPAGPFCGFS